MSDLFEEPDAGGGNAHEFTVSELSGAVKRVIEGEFGQVRVRGEIGRVAMPRSGHLYYDLKDDRAVIAAVTWKGQAARLSVRPEEGMEVIATGRMTTFPGQSKYQLIVDDIRPAGVGALMAMLEKRRKALETEGLFAAERKRPLPYLPEVIGVVTSPSGAVIRDILHRLSDRFSRRVLIWPVAVQGEKCAPEVARAIAGFNALPGGGPIPRPDVLIVARGGGSIEDLWGFNEEIVVRAAAASAIPLISAVGHETDITLIDHAADRRAPTPTAAAEIAVPVRLELLSWARDQDARLQRALTRALEDRRLRLRDLARALPKPGTLTEGARQRLDRADERLRAGLVAVVQRQRLRVSESAGSLRPALLRRLLAEARRVLDARSERLVLALNSRAERRRDRFDALAARLRPAVVQREAVQGRDRMQALLDRLVAQARGATEARRRAIEGLERVRLSLGYGETLKRGYAVVRGDGAVVTSTDGARAAREIELQFSDGRLKLGAASRKPKPSPKPPEQGKLL